jgi:hypothetical protein
MVCDDGRQKKAVGVEILLTSGKDQSGCQF